MVRWSSFPFIPGLHGFWLRGVWTVLGLIPPPPTSTHHRRPAEGSAPTHTTSCPSEGK